MAQSFATQCLDMKNEIATKNRILCQVLVTQCGNKQTLPQIPLFKPNAEKVLISGHIKKNYKDIVVSTHIWSMGKSLSIYIIWITYWKYSHQERY